jgi:ubiquinone/menaquinone biosynthesis C-methylase UbiE
MRADAAGVLPFRSASFDAVSCFGALHLFEHPLRALDEIARVLAPGGRVALMVTCNPDSGDRSDAAPVKRYGGVRMFAREEITGALRERGFSDVEQRITGSAQFVAAASPAADAGSRPLDAEE